MTQQQKDFLIELGKTDLETRKAFPELFGLKNGRWYGHKSGAIVLKQSDEGEGCGFTELGAWSVIDYWNFDHPELWHEASPETVKSALIAEAKKRYKVGDVVAELSKTDYAPNQNRMVSDKIECNDEYDVFFQKEDAYFYRLFHDGEWATVITPAPSIEDDIKALREKYPDYCLTVIVERK